MSSDMIYSNIERDGKDVFKNFTFSAMEWSAPTLTKPEDIREKLNGFGLCGRKIKRMRMIGLSYGHTRDNIEDTAYGRLKHLEKDERQRRSSYANIDTNIRFVRYAEIDEPLLIEFEDDDVFEVDVPQETEFRMSMNRIPWWIDAGTNQPNVDADILFSPCIGQKIVSADVVTYITENHPMYNASFDGFPYRRELVSNIILWLENGCGLKIGAWYDYCTVTCVDSNKKHGTIPFSKLKQALYNWGDLHTDEVTGIEAESSTVFFGRKGASRVGNPYMKMVSDGHKDSKLFITVDDFMLLDWCITHATGKWFDEYSDYRFTYKQWFDILDEAERFLSVESFDSLFDELVGWNITYNTGDNCMLWKLNRWGADFWKSKAKYQTQLNDLRRWSEIVLKQTDVMEVYGF